METATIAALLKPFVPSGTLGESELHSISMYIDILLRWNARMNLTAVRDPEQIVQRHFGESLFAASHLLSGERRLACLSSIDVGSGTGFPGMPLKIWAPNIDLTLIESQNRKATFLKEVVRSLRLKDVSVFTGRAEAYEHRADVVTLRAVEKFEAVLPVAAGLVRGDMDRALSGPELPDKCRAKGILALLIGATQVQLAKNLLPATEWDWDRPLAIPASSARVLLVGHSCSAGQ